MAAVEKTKLTLARRRRETADAISFRFKSEKLKSWRPGQYLVWTLAHPSPDGRGVDREFTISSAPFEGRVQLTTRFSKREGSSFKKALLRMTIGEAIEAAGPSGDFVAANTNRRLVFIAGGIGVTPYRAMLLALDRAGDPLNVDLLYADRGGEFPFLAELRRLADKRPAFRLHLFSGAKRLDAAAIAAAVGTGGRPVFYVSGPEPMVGAFEKTLKRMRVPRSRIKTDYFPGYRWP